MVCDKGGFERWCVTKVAVKDGGREAGGGEEAATRDTESKARTPHKVVGNNNDFHNDQILLGGSSHGS